MAGSRAGLKRVRKSVRTKRGTAQRTYWVKASPKKAKSAAGSRLDQAKAFVSRHKGKILAGAATAAALGAAYHANRESVKGGFRSARKAAFGGRHEGESFFGHAARVVQKARGGAKMGYAYDQKRRKDALAAGHWGARAAVGLGRVLHDNTHSGFLHELATNHAPGVVGAVAGPVAGVATHALGHYGQGAIRSLGRRLMKRHGVKARED